MNAIAIYAGSFDPVTNGHVWMIQEGARLFGPGNLLVCVAENPAKKYTFSLKDRMEMVAAVAPEESVRWIGNAYLVDYARMALATHLLRGIRNPADAEYERGMRNVNGDVAPAIQTVFLMPPRELCEVSSSMVKGLVGPEGWEGVVGRYVPPAVLGHLKKWSAR